MDVEKELEATYWESLDQMLTRVDIVSVNCPHTPGTYHLLSARRLRLLKPSAYIVNTARGEVIDENELARLIEAGAIAGAGLDVFEHEPAVNPKILHSDRVVALPHMSSATVEGRIDMGEKVIINIKAFLDGHAPPDRVHPAMFWTDRHGYGAREAESKRPSPHTVVRNWHEPRARRSPLQRLSASRSASPGVSPPPE